MQKSQRNTNPAVIAKASARKQSGSLPVTMPPHSTNISDELAISHPKEPENSAEPPSVTRKMVVLDCNSSTNLSQLTNLKFLTSSCSQSSAKGKKPGMIVWLGVVMLSIVGDKTKCLS